MALAPQPATASSRTAAAPHLMVCSANKGVGSFRFAVNGGKSFALAGGCKTVVGKAGVNKVSETSAPANYRQVRSISVSPSKLVVSSSVKTASVSLRIKTGSARISFANSKIATGGTGYVELCKYGTLNDPFTQGDFAFTVTSGSTATSMTVLTGTCSAPIPVTAGTVSVVENEPAPYQLTSVATLPAISLGSFSQAASSATITVPNNTIVMASFFNDPQLGVVKACKTLASNAAALEGDTFVFDVSWTFQPPAPAAAITGSGTVSVTAPLAVDTTVCMPYGQLLPVGTAVSITEDAALSPPDVSSTLTQIIPSSANAGSTSTMANVIVQPGATDALFTNGALGWIEVCKNPVVTYDKWNYVGSPVFAFSVNGGPSFPVATGSCSAAIEVPAGTATVTEAPSSDFYFDGVSTLAADDPTGARLLTSPMTNPATVVVPYGGVGNETVVTFTNHTDGAQLKVCVQETSPDANLGGATLNFWVNDGHDPAFFAQLTISPTDTNPNGEVCGMISHIFDAVTGPKLVPVSLSLTETPTTSVPAGTDIENVTYAGYGSGVSPDAFPYALTSSGIPFSFTIGAGENVVTFVNGRTAAS